MHGIWFAGGSFAVIFPVTPSRDTSSGKPVPGTSRLSAIATHGERTYKTTATSVGILGGEESGGITGGDTVPVVEGFGRTECPARTTVGLITDMTSDGSAIWPVGAHIESFWDIITGCLEKYLLGGRGHVSFIPRHDSA